MARALDKSRPAIVIGSGPNGLTAAACLAACGVPVNVYEAQPTVGGGCRTTALHGPGFLHDVCSSVHPMGVASPIWRKLKLVDHGLDWVHPDVPCAHPLDDQPAAALFRDVDETAAHLGEDGPRYRRRMAPFVERFIDLAHDGLAPLGLPRSPLLMARFGLLGFRSASSFVRGFRTERARALFGGLAGHSVLPFDMLPSAAIGLMLGLAGHAVGWPFPRGGAQAIVDALADLVRARGGVIETSRPISSLRELPDDAQVFFDTAPQALAEIAGEALPAGYRARLMRYRMGPGTCKVDLSLSAPIPWRDPLCTKAGTVHVGGTFAEMARGERAAWEGRLDDAPYVLVTQTTPWDPSRAPAGQHTAWAYCHVPHGYDGDRTEVILRQLERFAPGVRDVIVERSTMTVPDFERYNANYIGGDVVGGAATAGQLFTRPVARVSPYRTPHPRVFICSASTPPGGGVHGLCGYFAVKAAGYDPDAALSV